MHIPRVNLWSYNFDPEPTGIGPVSTVLARELCDAGYEVRVIAAHPHYPEPRWGVRRRPYREVRNGIPVLRLPLWVGRASTAERYRQELTFMAALTAAIPAVGVSDLTVVASPSFPALVPAIVNARIRREPWILWLHDILPDGAAATGVVDSGVILSVSRALERLAYREADRVVVLSRPFVENLRAKGVPADKIRLVYDPATRQPTGPRVGSERPLRILSMGNIGFSQGLAPFVAAFDAPGAIPDDLDAELVITGTGVAAADVKHLIRSDRVRMLGLVDDDRLEQELLTADVAFVSQQHDGSEFNIPSKLMNFMAYGLPILAAVNPAGEVARLVQEAGAGWVVDSSRPEAFPEAVRRVAADDAGRARSAAASREFADRHFTRKAFAAQFVQIVEDVRGASAKAVDGATGSASLQPR